MSRNWVSEKEHRNMREDYLDEMMSEKEIANKYNRGIACVSEHVKDLTPKRRMKDVKKQKNRLENKLSQKEIGYIAGIVDGEGHFSIGRNRGHLVGKLNITMSDENVIEWLSNLAELNYGVRDFKGRRRDQYRLRISKQSQLLALINLMKDQLIVKRKQAEVMKNFTLRKLRTIGKEDLKKFMKYKEKIQSLNY